MMVNAVGDDLCIGLGGELVPESLQLFAQLLVILDDPVVNNRETVQRNVGWALPRSGPP